MLIVFCFVLSLTSCITIVPLFTTFPVIFEKTTLLPPPTKFIPPVFGIITDESKLISLL